MDIKTKTVEPKIYSIYLRNGIYRSLSIIVEFTLEDAIEVARSNAVSEYNGDTARNDWKLEMYVMMESGEALLNILGMVDFQPKSQIAPDIEISNLVNNDKNILIDNVIKEKDLKYIEDNSTEFTAFEIEFIKNEINKPDV